MVSGGILIYYVEVPGMLNASFTLFLSWICEMVNKVLPVPGLETSTVFSKLSLKGNTWASVPVS